MRHTKSYYSIDDDCIKSQNKRRYDAKTLYYNYSNIYIPRDIIDIINKALSYYTLGKTYHNAIHGALVISTSMIIFSTLKNVFNNVNELVETMLTSAFHDAGRKGRDGVDIYEQKSGEIAKYHISGEMGENIALRILEGQNTLKDDVYYAYKGADSLNYPTTYNKNYNPLSKYSKKIICKDNILEEIPEIANYQKNLIIEVVFLKKIYELITGNIKIEEWIDIYEGVYDKEEEESALDLRLLFQYVKSYRRVTIKEVQYIGSDILSLCKYFQNNKYLTNNDRVFDDFWCILFCFLHFLPLHYRHLSYIQIPFRHPNLYQ
jgi:hypothetical protein